MNDYVLWGFQFVTAIILAASLLVSSRSAQRFERVERARFYLEIGKRWSDVLQLLYDVRTNPPPALEELQARYGERYDEFMATDLWKAKYRPICNFFEDLGFLVHEKNIAIHDLRILVTVSEDDYHLMSPVLTYLRTHYRKDIYEYWNFLLKESSNNPARSPFKRGIYVPKRPKLAR